MPLRRFVLLVGAICVSAVLLTVLAINISGDTDEKGATGKQAVDKKAPAYAYITSRELVVMRGERLVARLARIFVPSDPYQNEVVWTHNDDYVVTLSDAFLRGENQKSTELLFVNSRTGVVKRSPCPNCHSIAALGDRHVVALVEDDQSTVKVLKFDLNSPGRGDPYDGGDIDAWEWSYFLASTRQHVLVNAHFTHPSLPGDLFLSKVHGSQSQNVGNFESGYIWAAAAESSLFE